MADCSRCGFQPPEMHDRRQWTAVYVGSLAARMTMTGDGGSWNQRCAGCSRKDNMAPDTDLYKVPDAVPPIHAVSSHVAKDKDPSKFWSIFSDNLQQIATRGKKACGTLLVDIGCSSKRAPLSVSYYNEISSGHIGSCCC